MGRGATHIDSIVVTAVTAVKTLSALLCGLTVGRNDFQAFTALPST